MSYKLDPGATRRHVHGVLVVTQTSATHGGGDTGEWTLGGGVVGAILPAAQELPKFAFETKIFLELGACSLFTP